MLSALFLSLGMTISAATPAVVPLVNGHWEGVMERGSSRLAISVDLDVEMNRGYFSSTDLGALDIPLSSLRLGPALHWELVGDSTTTVFDASIAGDVMRGQFHENASSGTLILKRISASTAKPYAIHEVTFENGGVRLAGSVYAPRSAGKHPAVVLVHGSGPEGRWATAYIADYLARHGIIALSYDKRGVGASTGDWRIASMQDLIGGRARSRARTFSTLGRRSRKSRHLRSQPRRRNRAGRCV